MPTIRLSSDPEVVTGKTLVNIEELEQKVERVLRGLLVTCGVVCVCVSDPTPPGDSRKIIFATVF